MTRLPTAARAIVWSHGARQSLSKNVHPFVMMNIGVAQYQDWVMRLRVFT
jgi:hypothetical protein